jgi:hypothetical protein
MSRLTWRLVLMVLLPITFAVGSGCAREENQSGKILLVPGLAEGEDGLDRLQLKGAGNLALVTLNKKLGIWRVAQRGDWPADAGRVSQYLFVLSQAHAVEPKTSNPELYSRLGVEPISQPEAQGKELEISGAGLSSKLLIGNEHMKFNANYVRINGQAQTWLTDLPVSFDPDPAAWLDRRLVDLPLARIATVRVNDSTGNSFGLSHRDDRFRLDDAPSAAMHDSYQGDALASVLEQLKFEDVADDEGSASVERELRFTGVDGTEVSMRLWQVDEQVWVRLAASIDGARLAAWLQLAGNAEAADGLRAQVVEWNARFRSHRFLLSPEIATRLLLTDEQILSGGAGQ